MAGLIYSAVFGGKDKIRGEFPTLPDVDYLMFTDHPGKAPPPWSTAWVETVVSPRWTNRLFKWNFERLQPWIAKELDWVLYIDGSMTPTAKLTLQKIKAWLSEKDTAMFKHPHRTNVMQEYAECLKLKKMGKNLKLYSHLQTVKPKGLWAGGIVIRRPGAVPSPRLVFEGIEQFRCLRDQLIIPTVYTPSALHTIKANLWDNSYFNYRKHGS